MFVTALEDADKWVREHGAHWDGWDIFTFKPSPGAEFSTDGIRLDGRWGFKRTVPLTRKGWKVPRT